MVTKKMKGAKAAKVIATRSNSKKMKDSQSQRMNVLGGGVLRGVQTLEGKAVPYNCKELQRSDRGSEPPYILQDQDKMEIAYWYIDLANSRMK
jgi:hypothetical protein